MMPHRSWNPAPLVFLVLAASASAQTPGAAVQVSPSQLAFTDANIAFSQTLQVASDVDSITLDITIDGGSPNTPAPQWLELSSRTVTTPGRLRVLVGRLPASQGKFSARINFRVRAAGTAAPSVAVPVSLELSGAAPSFTVAPTSLRFLGQVGSFLPAQYIVLRGATCSEVTARTLDNWLTVAPEPIQNCNRFLVSVRIGLLRPRGYQGSIALIRGASRIDVPVNVFLVPPGPVLGTAPNGVVFEARQGNGTTVSRNIIIRNDGAGSFNWTARIVEAAGPAPWLSIAPESGSADSNTDGRVVASVNPGSLQPGIYYSLVEISAAGALNSPDLVPVVLRVEEAAAPPTATPSPSGLLFSVLEGSGASDGQAVTVFTSSNTAVGFRIAAETEDNSGDWLAASPVSGTTSTANSGRTTVTVRPGSLKPGVYRGLISTVLAGRNAEVRSVNVTMVVRPRGSIPAPPPPPREPPPQQPPTTPPSKPPIGSVAVAPHAENCTPTKLAPTHTGLVNSFTTRVGWPTPLNIRVLDDCGDVINGAQAVLTFSNGDPPLVMTNLLDGNYSGTWVPRNAASAAMTIRADVAQANLSASIELAGKVNTSASPIVEPNGVVNNFTRQQNGSLAPGTLLEIYGTNLAGGTVVNKLENNKLPDTVNDITVLIGSSRAPLYAVSPGLINAQVPVDARPGQLLPLIVRSGSNLSVPVRVPMVEHQPGVLQFADARVIAQDENFALIGTSNPARRGRYIVLYVTGMGLSAPEVPSGAGAPANPLALPAVPPTVTMGGKTAQVLFAGMTPSTVGLYQVNIVVPADLTPGEVDLVLTQGDVTSNVVKVPVR